MFSRKWVAIACLLLFTVLTYPSTCTLQSVSDSHLLSFDALICPFYTLQWVSACCLLAHFSCPDLSLPLHSLVGECYPAPSHLLSFAFLICPSLYAI